MVGAVFFIIAMTFAISYISYGMDTLDQYVQTVVVKSSLKEDRANEDFHIIKGTVDGNKFNLTVQNTGNVPITLMRLWVENVTVTATNTNPERHDLTTNNALTPGETKYNIGQSLSISPGDNSASYQMKLFTDRGNEKYFYLRGSGSEPVSLQLHAIPQQVANNFDTTLLFTVLNNMSRNDVMLNVKPANPPIISGSASATLVSGPEPSSYTNLNAGDIATFTWVYSISGNDGDNVSFTTSLENGILGNTATATVYVKDVEVSLQSGTSLQSKGFLSASTINNILVFHNEIDRVPIPGRQMYSAQPDYAGNGINIATTNLSFFTNNGTQIITIPTGTWNASLTYYSEPFPESLMDDTGLVSISNGRVRNMVMYHFEDGASSTTATDSSGNDLTMTLASAPNKPVWQKDTNSIHTDSGYYVFDGNDYMSSDKESENDIKDDDKFTGAWIKVTGGAGTDRTIFSAADDDNDEYYILMIDSNDDIVYEIWDDSNNRLKCTDSSTTLGTTNWHFIAAERTGNQVCDIYVNGTSTSPTISTDGDADIGNVDDDYVRIGTNWNNGKGFVGYIDAVFHWDEDKFDNTQHIDLSNANFGDKASLLDFILDETDKDGTLIENLKTDNSYSFPFGDGKGKSDGDAAKYVTANYTFFLPQTTVETTNRLNFSMNYNSDTDMVVRIDDFSINPHSSYLQFPKANAPFAGYIVLDNDDEPNLFIINTGQYGSWLSFFSTRLVFNDLQSDMSYAGIIKSVNGTTVDTNSDSMFLGTGKIAELDFHKAKSTPDVNPSQTNLIPPGNYQTSVFINGYDETGQVFLQTITLGNIVVVD